MILELFGIGVTPNFLQEHMRSVIVVRNMSRTLVKKHNLQILCQQLVCFNGLNLISSELSNFRFEKESKVGILMYQDDNNVVVKWYANDAVFLVSKYSDFELISEIRLLGWKKHISSFLVE